MAVACESSYRAWSHNSQSAVCLEDKFELLKDIGDGSFGSVSLARVRGAGAHIARKGTLVAIKTMKKTFESFNHCLELREVIFLRSLPNHPHLVPALDIFLDPLSRKLHIAMECMDGNLYQLMKARDHKRFDAGSVKSILFQIMLGLEHIHDHQFFHRDIKPENILVTTSSPSDVGSTFKRYSALVTPPSTPPVYSIKIADFGLARETHSKLPYTTYVSTRWYRAPEVLLRAGEYSAPVDIWAIGAMAVEIATLKPLFPGGNEVDQVWRVCEIMGSPGTWINKQGAHVGGGDWRDGIRLAQKLGFAFPKMAPHAIDTILQAPEWPASLSNFVTWCLMWDPRNRPTSTQALSHEYFVDAFDPLRPKSSASRILGRKQPELSGSTLTHSESTHSFSSKTSSWFRKSLVARESAPAVPQHVPVAQTVSPRPSPVHSNTVDAIVTSKVSQSSTKRATWQGVPPNAAPIPILPSIKPISPLSDAVTAQANVRPVDTEEKAVKKIGRQLSVASKGNHYADIHRQEAERALNGHSGVISPTSGHKESFFSHLRKRARRLSGRTQAPPSPNSDDIEARAGCAPWGNNRHSIVLDQPSVENALPGSDFTELDRALQNVRYSLEAHSQAPQASKAPKRVSSNPILKRSLSLPRSHGIRPSEHAVTPVHTNGPISSRTRRAITKQTQPSQRYETPDEEEELLDEVLTCAHRAAKRLDRHAQQDNVARAEANAGSARPPLQQSVTDLGLSVSYLTPSPSANRDSVNFEQADCTSTTKPLDILQTRTKKEDHAPQPQWPTPPYEENEWAAAAAASIFAAQAAYQ